MELRELQRAMARLPAQTRMLLLMIAVEGVSYEDASAQLGLAVGTLKCRVFRARQQMRDWMMGEENVAPLPLRKRAVIVAEPSLLH